MQERKDSTTGGFIKDTMNQIKKTIHGDPTSIEEIQESLRLSRDADIDFVEVLEKHHEFLEESISVLTDNDAEIPDKQFHLERFLRLLRMHGVAEQETLYVALKDNAVKEARLEGFGGQDEHEVAFQMSDELFAMKFQDAWTVEIEAKAKVVANLVKNHIQEEESQMFSIAKEDIPEAKLQDLTGVYIDKCVALLAELQH
jgi:hemerythrin-like domain-containing protein